MKKVIGSLLAVFFVMAMTGIACADSLTINASGTQDSDQTLIFNGVNQFNLSSPVSANIIFDNSVFNNVNGDTFNLYAVDSSNSNRQLLATGTFSNSNTSLLGSDGHYYYDLNLSTGNFSLSTSNLYSGNLYVQLDDVSQNWWYTTTNQLSLDASDGSGECTYYSSITGNTSSATPEPASLLMVVGALLGLGFIRRQRLMA